MEKYNYSDLIVLGSTGSVGTQAIDVAKKEGIKVLALSADSNVKLIESQARELGVSACAMSNENAAKELKIRLADTDIKVYSGKDGICSMIHDIDSCGGNTVAINSIVGGAGLLPTLAVLNSGKRLALANKESLVVGGHEVMRVAREKGTEILPVDSEHSAIFQCLRSGDKKEIKRILLTASGGPFFGKTRDELAAVTVADTLAHPTWNMGRKITVDSATLMNKGFEVIEAAHLFGIPADRIKVIVHRESILHSAVEYIDNSVIGEFSVPDMRMCVQYAVDYPDRCESVSDELDITKIGSLTFREPDTEAFPLLSLAKYAYAQGGAVCAVMNAADEIAVEAFLLGKIGFNAISDTVIHTVEALADARHATELCDIISCDRQARAVAQEYIKENQ